MEIFELKLNSAVSHIALSGKLDEACIEKIRIFFSRLVLQSVKPLILDLSETYYICENGLELLHDLSEKAPSLLVLNPQPELDDTVRKHGITVMYDYYEALNFLGVGTQKT